MCLHATTKIVVVEDKNVSTCNDEDRRRRRSLAEIERKKTCGRKTIDSSPSIVALVASTANVHCRHAVMQIVLDSDARDRSSVLLDETRVSVVHENFAVHLFDNP
jgi:hypothetical protein